MFATPYIVNGVVLPLILLSLRYSNHWYLKHKKKAPTNICKISFLNKGVELINVPWIFYDTSVKACLSIDINFHDATVANSLVNSIKTKIFNFIKFWLKSTISHTNFETNPRPTIINVVCKSLRRFICTSFNVATLPTCWKIQYEGETWLISAKWTIKRISRSSSRNWLGLNNVCAILFLKLRKLCK